MCWSLEMGSEFYATITNSAPSGCTRAILKVVRQCLSVHLLDDRAHFNRAASFYNNPDQEYGARQTNLTLKWSRWIVALPGWVLLERLVSATEYPISRSNAVSRKILIECNRAL